MKKIILFALVLTFAFATAAMAQDAPPVEPDEGEAAAEAAVVPEAETPEVAAVEAIQEGAPVVVEGDLVNAPVTINTPDEITIRTAPDEALRVSGHVSVDGAVATYLKQEPRDKPIRTQTEFAPFKEPIPIKQVDQTWCKRRPGACGFLWGLAGAAVIGGTLGVTAALGGFDTHVR